MSILLVKIVKEIKEVNINENNEQIYFSKKFLEYKFVSLVSLYTLGFLFLVLIY